MKIAVISTSPRQGSNSLKVAKYLASLAQSHEETEVSLVDFLDADIPFIGRGELSPDTLTKFQKKLVAAWEKADLLVFVVPEYNWNTGGELINAFHQLGNKPFRKLFDDKVFAFAGVSNGKGGRLPGIEMTTMVNKLISVMKGYSIVSPKIFESQYTQNVLDEEGKSKGDTSYERAAADFVDFSLKVAARWKK